MASRPRSSYASCVHECSECGEEYEIEFVLWTPDKSVGDHGGAELDGPTKCPACGHEPDDDEVEEMGQRLYEGADEDEAGAYADYLYERSRDGW